MAGPWEKYQTAQASGPWLKYAQAAATQAAPGQQFRDGVPIGGAPDVMPAGALPSDQVGAGMPARDEMNPDSAVRMLANGMTFGLADKAAGAMDAATGKADSYDAGVKAQRAETEKVRTDNPVAAGAAELAGGLVTGAGLVWNGATLAGRMGGNLAGRMAGYGLEGAAYGAAHGAGNTYSEKIEDYLDAAGKGAGWGCGLGVGIPVAGSIAGKIFRMGRATAGPTIENASRSASAILRNAADADAQGLRDLSRLGPEAMLPDAGPAMLGLAQGAGTGVGPGRTQLVNALRDRDAGTVDRITSILADNLGPAPIPSRVRAGLDDSKERIGEMYRRPFAEASPVDTRDLAESLDEIAQRVRGPAQAAVRRVRGYLDEVPDPNAPPPAPGAPRGPQLDSDPRTLFETRQAIDGLLTGETDPKVIRQLSMARQSVDELLQHSVPRIKEVDGRFAEIARQDEALTRGGQVFDTGKAAIRPSELADEIQQGALPQGQAVGPSAAPYRLRQGARAEVDRLVGTTANDLNALERKLGTPEDWNNAKFGIVFGEPQRDAVVSGIGANRRFRQTYQDVVQNSQTAQRTAAKEALDNEPALPLDTTMTGAGVGAARLVLQALLSASKNGTRDEVGRLLASKGEDAQRLIAELLAGVGRSEQGASTLRRFVGNPSLLGASGQYSGRR